MKRRNKYLLVIFLGLAVLFSLWLVFPMNPFPQRDSTVITSKNGEILRIFLSPDKQFRFPSEEHNHFQLPEKYLLALLTYEDKRFFNHPGIDPIAIIRAFYKNLKAGKIVSGASTITMQTARMMGDRPRNLISKIIEAFEAIKLELHHSKMEILELYTNHLPMGGNIVGLSTATRLYSNRSPAEFTWAEAALYAVLPKSPSWIHLNKHKPLLKKRRNQLLQSLHQTGYLDSLELRLSKREPLPSGKRNIPFSAPHATRYLESNLTPSQKGKFIKSTLDYNIQKKTMDAALLRNRELSELGIENLSVLVADTKTGEVRAYVGSQSWHDTSNQGMVDGVRSPRGTGSVLKPFLYGKLLDRHGYFTESNIPDIPTYFGTFTPKNSSGKYSGLVDMRMALVQSLNVPAVRALYLYGVHDFYSYLNNAGLAHLFRTPMGYGLSLIIGGAEASLWELTGMYLSLGNQGCKKPPTLVPVTKGSPECEENEQLLSPGASWLVLNMLTEVERPENESNHSLFQSYFPIAWKTGTGNAGKDAWALGISPQWTIGVWAGNFSGEGNPNLTGSHCAGPLLFDLMRLLTDNTYLEWFPEPVENLVVDSICELSGFAANQWCPVKKAGLHPVREKSRYCSWHRGQLIETKTGHSVCSRCWKGHDTTWSLVTVFPPHLQTQLTKLGYTDNKTPVHLPSCPVLNLQNHIDIIYPPDDIVIFPPRGYDEKRQKIVLEAASTHSGNRLFWYLNNDYLGVTEQNHEMTAVLQKGRHKLVVQDPSGSKAERYFTVSYPD